MRMRKKIDFPKLFLYIVCGLCSVFLSQIGDTFEPFSLPLFFGMASAGLSPVLSAILYLVSGTLAWDLPIALLYFGQAVLLCVGFYLQRRYKQTAFLKTGVIPLIALSLCLGLFVGFAPFTLYEFPFTGFLQNLLFQKVLLAAVIFLLSAIFSVVFKALLHKLLRCRLREDEIVFSLFSLVLVGVGMCRFLGVNAYMGIAFFLLLLYATVTKDASAPLCAFLLSLPPLLVFGISPARFFLYGVVLTLFAKSGRLASSCAFLIIFFAYGYLDGLYVYPTDTLIASVLSALLPTLFFILLPTPLMREIENKLIFYREKHLSRIAINRNRTAVGQQLFEISSVFREIQSAFMVMGENDTDEASKNLIRTTLTQTVCEGCPDKQKCLHDGGRSALNSLIEIGCVKGRVNLMDIPRELCEVCANQSTLLYALNGQLAEYKKYRLEAENAASGRQMLAKQAQGVSEILKNLALEQSAPLTLYTEKERALSLALLRVGIVCSEVLVCGEEEDYTLSLITFGKADVKKIAAVASHVFGTDMMISKRLSLSNDKFCCILRKKPYFDAAFGVACMRKTGETVSGDTHSVIKIDEGRFLVALSDGMGSGEYAKQISETTLSLLESFYRAKMSSELVLSTLNKLLTFNKEESFACVDIGIVDLNSGQADIVKIGSPFGFILSGNTVKVLENASLPLGILDAIRPTTAEYTLAENDILVFISDGISDAFGSSADLYESLRGIPAHNPQQLADCLLARALQAYGGTAKDDMTVVAVRLFKSA
ncbi:MAG: SpoIIE family protein phosphatase [Clostridia bacterium]|nr:SpoIIE family protein phosphatase [Clostridia bacterium]